MFILVESDLLAFNRCWKWILRKSCPYMMSLSHSRSGSERLAKVNLELGELMQRSHILRFYQVVWT